MKKGFLIGLVIFIHSIVYSQVATIKGGANSSNVSLDKENAVVTILWPGPGQAKLLLNKEEYLFSDGEKKTLNIASQNAYIAKVEQGTKNYISSKPLEFAKGKQSIILCLVNDSLVVNITDKLISQLDNDMVLVAGGSYLMGCANAWGSPCTDFEKRNGNNTTNVDSFYISKYHVTQEQWQIVMGNNPSYFKNCKNCPVENISWIDAHEFIRRLNQLSGKHYRLPTSAEWEYAAKGGTKRKGDYYAGNVNDIAWNNLTELYWEYIMGSKLSNFKNCDYCPVKNLSWDNAKAFVAKLNQMDTEKHYPLPSEAEWKNITNEDNAQRGYKYAGSNNLDEVAWYYGNSGYTTHPVGQKKPNELGLYDMNGNVWQWCSDWFNIEQDPSNDGKLAEKPQKHIFRGSAWSMDADEVRITLFWGNVPEYKFSDIGLRLVRDVY